VVSSRQPLERKPAPDGGYALLPPLAPSTTVPASTTTHRRNTVSSVEPMLTLRSDCPMAAFRRIHSSWGSRPFMARGLEVWRARFRYCQHDVGHALGTLRFAACRPGLETLPPRPCRRHITASRTQPRRRLRRRGARTSELLAVVVRGTGSVTGASAYPRGRIPGGRLHDGMARPTC